MTERNVRLGLKMRLKRGRKRKGPKRAWIEGVDSDGMDGCRECSEGGLKVD
jgi:hypothetical protein